MKRLLASLLILAMLLSTGLFTVSAAGSGSLGASGGSGYRGDTVTVNVNLNSNPGLITMRFQVSYSDNLTLVSVSNSGLLNGWTTPAPTIASPYTLRWADSLATENNTATGKLVTLTFKIAEDATIGNETVSILFSESRDAEGGKNSFSGASATITIKCNHNYGNWTKLDDADHGKTCSICQDVQKEGHKWDGGKETKKATCKEEGVKTFTCTVCNATRTEAIEKTDDHVFGNLTSVDDQNHKDTCSVCQKEITEAHKWDSGKVTKKETCKEEGEKTYTCSGCKATKTEKIPVSTEHTYGTWVKVDDNNHKATCSVCQKEETAGHSWNSGAVTKKATCKEEGEKTYTCTGCSATKNEVIPMSTTHTWGKWEKVDADNHKRICSVCQKEESEGHNYKTSWSKDKNEHWHECSVCRDKKDTAAHTPSAEPTETKPQTCTICNYVIKPALGHKHNYATQWTNDETGHWYVCPGCEEKGSYADHDFENACDPDCSICGFTRETAHIYEEKWATDGTSHWHVCDGCGLKADEGAHEPGAAATATSAQVCTVCDYEIAPALGESTEPAETTESTTPDDEDLSDTGSFPWWIILVAVAVVGSGIAVFFIFKKKED